MDEYRSGEENDWNVNIGLSSETFLEQINLIGVRNPLSVAVINGNIAIAERLLAKSIFTLSELTTLSNFKQLCEMGYIRDSDIRGKVYALLGNEGEIATKKCRVRIPGQDDGLHGYILHISSSDYERGDMGIKDYTLVIGNVGEEPVIKTFGPDERVEFIFDSGSGRRKTKSRRKRKRRTKNKRVKHTNS